MSQIGPIGALVALIAVAFSCLSQRPHESGTLISESEAVPKPPAGSLSAASANEMSSRAARYLWQHQSKDGGWHSETYGLLKSGQSLTPFVLYALINSSTTAPEGAVDNALQFMRDRINADGVLGTDDPDILDYPNYATAYALICFKQFGDQRKDSELIERMQNYLISEQFCEARGFSKSAVAYGGWGFGGTQGPGETGHMDLAHARRVLQALTMEPCHKAPLQIVFKRSQQFLKMVQKHPGDKRPQPLPAELKGSPPGTGFDGGFYFSPIVLRANKGRVENSGHSAYWRSYATATCDGVLGLLAAGVSPSDERVVSAVKWLDEHDKLEYPEGIPPLFEGENWRDAVFFYHLSVRGEVRAALAGRFPRRNKTTALLKHLQNPDGSFVNRNSALMKEDDPIICTALALIALSK